MNVLGKPHRTIWPTEARDGVHVIDQTLLPHRFEVVTLRSSADATRAIRDMVVRGAPLIGAAGAYGLALAMLEDPTDAGLASAYRTLAEARPTAINLAWALDRVRRLVLELSPGDRAEAAFAESARICDEDIAACSAIGDHGFKMLLGMVEKSGRDRIDILTHCNAGWLATVDWGTALSPIYKAHRAGLSIHVWVDETRPRNQGAALTAWELGMEGVPCTLIADNVGGHLMQHGMVDLCIVGSDRTTAIGDVCNKIGTYLKALSASDNDVPFFAALPSSTVDWSLDDGLAGIPIERRAESEVTHIAGETSDGRIETVRIAPPGCRAANYAFDVTPARLITGGIITERGICKASRAGLASLFPEYAARPASPLV